ncbi:MAG: TetR/AcrR family transcriptional regulator [Actinomycetia bacterium]|nr:TetR/AcrR family transcriptional regulator [Actinomycetes bacterium]
MTSRREQKKHETFDSIVSAAARSFRDNGYHGSTIEVIAAEAGVSASTVYNYFGTKNAVLLAVVTRDTEHALVDAGETIDLSSGDPVEVLMPLIMVYADAMMALGRDVLKELFRAGFDPAESAVMADLVSLDERSILQISQVFTLMQGHGMASDTVDSGSAAVLIYSVVAVATLMFVSMPEMTARDVETMIRSQLRLVFRGLGGQGPAQLP